MQQRPSFESLFRLSPNAYVLLDPALVIIDANPAYTALTGRTLESLLGRPIHKVFAADGQQFEAAHVQELLDSFARVLSRKAVDTLPVIRYPVACETPEGPVYQERYWSATHTPVLDADGEIMAILQHTMDITELQPANDSRTEGGAGPAAGAIGQPLQQLEGAVIWRARLLQDEGRLLRQLFAQAPGFICFLRGPEHIFEIVNDAYQQLTGFRQLIGKTVREGLPEVEEQVFFGLLDHVYETGEVYIGKRMRVLLRRRPGAEPEEAFIDFIYQPIVESDGQVSGIFVQGSDVTEQHRNEQELRDHRERLEDLISERTRELLHSESERRATEAALLQAQKLEAVGKLTGGIAHDFNNMLQIIGGNLQLLRRSLAGDDTAQRRLASAASGVEKGSRLATQLLAFASRQSLHPQTVMVGELLEQMGELLRGSLGRGVQVEIDVERGLWPVFADVGNLQSAVLNLAVNARDAMPNGGRLLVRARNRSLDAAAATSWPEAEEGDYVVLSVIDEGEGMSADVQMRAFEPFFSTKQGGSSSGLGLSMVYGFVRQSGGFVILESEAPGGTSLHIHLPRGVAADSDTDMPVDQLLVEEEVTADAPAVVATDTQGLKILFVEDDPTLRMLTGEVMLELGHEVCLSESAEDALAHMDGDVFDVLLTDVGLAGMSGIELVRQARVRDPALSVVIASGYAVDAQEEGLGDLRTMLKPYDIQQVRTLLESIQAERASRRRV